MKYPLKSHIILFLVMYIGASFGLVLKAKKDYTREDIIARNAETCGDANNAVLWVKYWLPPAKSHLVWDSAHFTKSALNVGGIADYTYVGDAFYAFQTQETGTVPLWFFSKLQGDDFMIATGNADGSTPSPPAGFAVSFVLGYAYPSQICDSVPLFVVYDSTTTDHYFTIDPREKQGFLAVGYVDQGIVAYVLPLDDDTN